MWKSFSDIHHKDQVKSINGMRTDFKHCNEIPLPIF